MTEVESFRAVIMDQTLRHRGGDLNLVPQFVTSIERELSRYQAKDLDSATSDAITKLADAAIERARKAGRVLAYSPAGA